MHIHAHVILQSPTISLYYMYSIVQMKPSVVFVWDWTNFHYTAHKQHMYNNIIIVVTQL